MKVSVKIAAVLFPFALISCAHGPASNSNQKRAVANMSIPETATLQDVYGMSYADVEDFVFDHESQECQQLISVYKQGQDDPAKLSPAEFCAVQNYSNSRYSVNKGLWLADSSGKSLSGWDWAYVRVLDEALKKIANAPAMTVYRGTSRKELVFDKVGKTYRLKGYSSTTPTKDVAEGFLRDRLMIINIVSGKNIKNYSNAGGEDEFLLPRSTYVRLDKKPVIQEIEIFTEEGPEKRKVEMVYLTEVPK